MKRRTSQSAAKKERTSDTPTPHRKMISVEITPPAFEAMKQVSARTGMRQKIMTGRILEWFASLPQIEQQIILGAFGDDDKDVALFSDLLIRRRISELVADDRLAYFSGMNVALNLLSQMPRPAAHPGAPQSRDPKAG